VKGGSSERANPFTYQPDLELKPATDAGLENPAVKSWGWSLKNLKHMGREASRGHIGHIHSRTSYRIINALVYRIAIQGKKSGKSTMQNLD
jgi:hypothetical protein